MFIQDIFMNKRNEKKNFLAADLTIFQQLLRSFIKPLFFFFFFKYLRLVFLSVIGKIAGLCDAECSEENLRSQRTFFVA